MNNARTQIKAVVFDLGGVLEFDSRKHVDAHAAKAFGVNSLTFAKKIAPLLAHLQKGEITERQMWQRFAKSVGKPLEDNWRTLLREPHSKHFYILDDTLQIVRELKRKGFKLGLLSNTQAAHERIEHRQRTFKPFDFVFLSHLQGMRKPDSNAYRTVLRKLGVKPSEAVFVDNVQAYVSAANKVGMHGIWFKSSHQLRKALERMKIL